MRRLLPTAAGPATAPLPSSHTTYERPTAAVAAHRGASADAPENTLAAVDEAVAQRADSIEIDVRRTADGHLVLLHDATLTRTTDVEKVLPARALEPVGTFTLDELRRLDAGSWFGAEFAGEPIPTFEEFLERTGDRAGVLVELKNPATYPGIEKDLAQALGEPRPGVVVQSFDHDAMGRFAEAAPGITSGWLFATRPCAVRLDEATAAGIDQINSTHRVVDRALVDEVRTRGMQTGVYTVNEETDMRRMIDAGVDRIITDRPSVLRGVLGG